MVDYRQEDRKTAYELEEDGELQSLIDYSSREVESDTIISTDLTQDEDYGEEEWIQSDTALDASDCR